MLKPVKTMLGTQTNHYVFFIIPMIISIDGSIGKNQEWKVFCFSVHGLLNGN